MVQRVTLNVFPPKEPLLGWLDFPSDKIHQFMSSIWPEFLENLLSFIVRTIRIVEDILNSCLFSHDMILSHHHIFQLLSHLTLVFGFMQV